MTTSSTHVRTELRKAKRILDAAENLAMAADGPVTPTRQCLTDEEFDTMMRHVLEALKWLTPTEQRGRAWRTLMNQGFAKSRKL
jgi:hypothetical protein